MTNTTPSLLPPEDPRTDPSVKLGDEGSVKELDTRQPWTLQRRLIATGVSITSLILVLVAVATSVILVQVLEAQLSDDIKSATHRAAVTLSYPAVNGMTAEQVLTAQPQLPGYLLVLDMPPGNANAAVMTSDGVVALDNAQMKQITSSLRGQNGQLVVTIDGLGTYRVEPLSSGGSVTALVGLSRDNVTETTARMLITIALLTVGGLILLAAAMAWTINAGLAPLRAIADTAGRVSNLKLDQGDVTISERVPDPQADPRTETGRVGAALNSLLDHVGESLAARQRNEERMREFVADASHELRTPLTSIRGYSELSLKALDRDHADGTVAATKSSLERIQAQSLRMTSLVEELLLLTRLEEGQELVYGTVDLTRLVVEALSDARPTGPDHEWVLAVDDDPVVIDGDVGRLHQVVTNLLANARTHTPSGTTVTVSVGRDGHDAVLRVHDDGPGIDPAIAEELFERFARGDRSRTRQTGGTGLGLSITRAIIEAHNGNISVQSTPHDTTFEVRLPLHHV